MQFVPEFLILLFVGRTQEGICDGNKVCNEPKFATNSINRFNFIFFEQSNASNYQFFQLHASSATLSLHPCSFLLKYNVENGG